MVIFNGIFLGQSDGLSQSRFTGRMLTNGCPTSLAATNERCPLQRYWRGHHSLKLTATDGVLFPVMREGRASVWPVRLVC